MDAPAPDAAPAVDEPSEAEAGPDACESPAEPVVTPPVTDAQAPPSVAAPAVAQAPEAAPEAPTPRASTLRPGVEIGNAEDSTRTVIRHVCVPGDGEVPAAEHAASRQRRHGGPVAGCCCPGEAGTPCVRQRTCSPAVLPHMCRDIDTALLCSAPRVTADDRPGLLLDLTELLKAQQVRGRPRCLPPPRQQPGVPWQLQA